MATIEILASKCVKHAVVVLGGELDATGSGQVETTVGDVLAAGRSVIVDVSSLEFIVCAAVNVLRRCQAQAQAAGADLLLAGPGGVVVRLLTLTPHRGHERLPPGHVASPSSRMCSRIEVSPGPVRISAKSQSWCTTHNPSPPVPPGAGG
jgi:anti-anti-sigma factor